MSAFVTLAYHVNVSPALSFAPAIYLDSLSVWVDAPNQEFTYASLVAGLKAQHFDPLPSIKDSLSPERYEGRKVLIKAFRKILQSQQRKVAPNQGPIQLIEEPSEVRPYSLVHTLMVSVQWYDD